MRIDRILEKYKLIDRFQTQLDLTPEQFESYMGTLTEKGSSSRYLSFFDLLRASEYEFIGLVRNNQFNIRERIVINKLGIPNRTNVKAVFKKDGDQLTVDTKLQGMGYFTFFGRVLIVVFYALVLVMWFLELLLMLFSSDAESINEQWFAGPMVLTLIVALLVYIPYDLAKSDVIKMKKEMKSLYQWIERSSLN